MSTRRVSGSSCLCPLWGAFSSQSIASATLVLGEEIQLEGAEKEILLQALKEHRGDKQAAAWVLGIALSTLYAKLKKYQL